MKVFNLKVLPFEMHLQRSWTGRGKGWGVLLFTV